MAQPDSLVGLQIGNFLVRRHLARGGMADVYLAENVRLQREVALKVLLPSFVENAAFVERFRREAQAMARLQHRNIVAVYDTGDTPDGRPFIAMQYVRGGTLEGLLADLEGRGQVMTVAYALAVGRQVADALATAHRAGIIHRDLKPSNILLDDQRRPLLTDLGIAYVQDTQRLTRTDTFIGTPHYMSPEQGKGLPLDARSDIYSLGVVLFELLAGQRPFPGDSHWALIHQHVTEPAPSLADVRAGMPRPVAALVGRCLEKEPGRRYQSAGELAAAIDQVLGQVGAAGAVSPSGEWQWQPRQTADLFVDRAGKLRPLPKRGKRPGWLPAALGGLGLVAALVMLWLLFRPQPEPPATPAATPGQLIVEVTVQVTVPGGGPATSTVGPTAGATDTAGPPPTAAPTSTPVVVTATPSSVVSGLSSSAATVRVTTPVFTRLGPGMAYGQSGSLGRDEVVAVLADDGRGDWLLVQPARGGPVWVSATFVTFATGAAGDVAMAATIPALPTTAATATVPPSGPPPPPPATATGGGGGGGGNRPTTEPPTAEPPTVRPTNTPAPGPTDTGGGTNTPAP